MHWRKDEIGLRFAMGEQNNSSIHSIILVHEDIVEYWGLEGTCSDRDINGNIEWRLRSGDEQWRSARPMFARGCWRQLIFQPTGSNPSNCRRAKDHRRQGVEEVAAIVADEMNCWAIARFRWFNVEMPLRGQRLMS